MIWTLLEDNDLLGASDAADINASVRSIIAQVDIKPHGTGEPSATVKVEGRIGDDYEWVETITFNKTGIKRFSALPQMRFKVTHLNFARITAGFSLERI